MTEEWGPWIEHDCNGCAVEDGFLVQIECYTYQDRNYRCEVQMGRDYTRADWNRADSTTRMLGLAGQYGILRYRIRKPRALQELIKLAQDVPEQVDA